MVEMNRRNVLVGMGGLAIGGGALLGSGAFTSVSAERDVEVNVLVDGDIGDSDQFADVLVNVGGYDTVAVDDDGTLNTDGEGLFPTDTDNYPDFGEEYVSLLQNDVTLVFGFEDGGEDNRLLPNSTTNYGELIALVNTNDDPTEGEHSLTFNNDDFDLDTEVNFDPDDPEDVVVGGEDADEFDVSVTSDDEDDTGGILEITIE